MDASYASMSFANYLRWMYCGTSLLIDLYLGRSSDLYGIGKGVRFVYKKFITSLEMCAIVGKRCKSQKIEKKKVQRGAASTRNCVRRKGFNDVTVEIKERREKYSVVKKSCTFCVQIHPSEDIEEEDTYELLPPSAFETNAPLRNSKETFTYKPMTFQEIQRLGKSKPDFKKEFIITLNDMFENEDFLLKVHKAYSDSVRSHEKSIQRIDPLFKSVKPKQTNGSFSF